MQPPPPILGGARVLMYSVIDSRHRHTCRTKHFVGDLVQGPAAALAICGPEDDGAFYLFGCDEAWKVVTDTYHESLEEAKEQAEWEYTGVSQTWRQM